MRTLSLALLACHALLTVTPASAQGSRLPPAMIGVWAPAPDDCRDREGEVADGRIEVTAGTVETFVSILSVERWRRRGDRYRGTGRMSEEGEGAPEPGQHSVQLRLAAGGRLEVRWAGGQAERFVRCPVGVRVR